MTGHSFISEVDGERLDVFLARALGRSRSFAQKIIEAGNVSVNSKPVGKNYVLKAGDSVTASVPEPVSIRAEAEDIALDIVYNDDDIAVINKPQGMVVHPAAGNWKGTLVNALLGTMRLSGINGELRPGIVHRLDKDTSGLIAIAKNDMAHASLSAQLKERTMKRTYMALVAGNVKADSGTVNAPIGRHPVNRKKMAVLPGGRDAVTHYRVLERYGCATLIEARLETGRTHQIRVHMAHIGYPVLGDAVYSSAKNDYGLSGQALHACRLELTHPRTGERMSFSAPLPEWFEKAIQKARNIGKNRGFL